MHFDNPFRLLNRLDYVIWGGSVLIVAASFLLFSGAGVLSLIASLIGVTALIYMAKGHPYGHLLTIVFSLFYGVISFFFRYYGEMLTYLGMTMPMAAVSLWTWLKNPYGKSRIVTIRQKLSVKLIVWMLVLTAAATAGFGWMLALLHTANLPVSIVSITTSFLAAYLTACRSPYYALAYAANDLVLIVLWILAARQDASCIPMTACFAMFLVNDAYAFISWRRRAGTQLSALPDPE